MNRAAKDMDGVEISLNPGIREYCASNRSFMSGLSLPLCCFGIVSLMLIICGALVHIWARTLKSEYNLPFKTFGSAVLSLGIFVAVISCILSCEACISGRCFLCPDLPDENEDSERRTLLSETSIRRQPSSVSISIDDQGDGSSPDTHYQFGEMETDHQVSRVTFPIHIPSITITRCQDNITINGDIERREKARSLP